jgi:penicillin amidase
VVHISGQDELDVVYASGYVSARERLWQMELMRRLAKGQLSEIFGSETVSLDKLSLILGLDSLTQRHYREVSEQSQKWLEKYAQGINAYLNQIGNDLPIEFILMDFKPETWSPQDCLLQNRLMSWFLNFNWKADVLYWGLASALPAAKFREIWPSWADYPDITSKKGTKNFLVQLSRFQEKLSEIMGMGQVYAGSNSWVISSQVSQSGSAMLANDPHLQIQFPSLWMEMSLNATGLNVSGFTLPGSPGIIIGRNNNYAWGLTNGMIDDCDYFIENIDTVRGIYWRNEQSYPLKIHNAIIRIKDKPIQRFKIYGTSHGPIINSAFPDLLDLPPLSVKWVGWEKSDELFTFIQLAKGQNWADFREALRDYVVPAQNFIYADVSGNIGYQLAGRIPVRTYETGLIPQEAHDSGYSWSNWIPFERMPALSNPPKGYIITANNRIVDNSSAYYSELWEPPFRAMRIEELIQSKSVLSLHDMKMIQFDKLNILARQTVPFLLRNLADSISTDEYAEKIKILLSNWDFMMETESIPAAFYELWMYHLIQDIFKDEMGSEYFQQFTDLPNFYIRIFFEILMKENSAWFDNTYTEREEERSDIINQSFVKSVGTLKSMCGNALENWRWGEIHKVKLSHVLGRYSLTDILFNRGPLPAPGNLVTVNVATYSYNQPFHMIVGPSLRFLVDWSEPGQYQSIFPGGNSGNFLSDYYDNQFEIWLKGGYKKVILKPLENSGELILVPEGK